MSADLSFALREALSLTVPEADGPVDDGCGGGGVWVVGEGVSSGVAVDVGSSALEAFFDFDFLPLVDLVFFDFLGLLGLLLSGGYEDELYVVGSC